MKFVHAADLHLDSPLRGLVRYEGAPVERMRAATRAALANLVGLCLDEGAAFLLLAGDLFDGDWRDYGTGLFFLAQMARLREAGIQVFLVRGNHDAQSQITRALTLPEHVHEFSTRRPETQVLEEHGVAIHGQGFAARAVSDDLALRYPAPRPGLLNIGLLHTSVDGRPGHESYAPCGLPTLRDKGYDYWALGHVHAREVLAQRPWVVFPGNLQGRHARETGAKGATLVTVQDGRITAVEHRALDAVRWLRCAVDARGAADADAMLDQARAALRALSAQAEGRALAVPVTVRVRAAVHRVLCAAAERWTNDLRALALDALGDTAWLERVEFATEPEAAPTGRVDDDALVWFRAAVQAAASDPAALGRLGAQLQELERKLPAEVREGADGLSLSDPDTLRRLVADAAALVEGRLAAGGAAP